MHITQNNYQSLKEQIKSLLAEVVKDPYVFEFLGIEQNHRCWMNFVLRHWVFRASSLLQMFYDHFIGLIQ